MPEKRMLIVPAELVRRIDENRGDLAQAEFLEFLIDSRLTEKVKEPADIKKYITKEEFHSFEEDTKKLLKSFLDFFVSYGMELGKQSPQAEFEELTAKLHELESDLASEGKGGEAKIKWK
jgi:hypothetical protein